MGLSRTDSILCVSDSITGCFGCTGLHIPVRTVIRDPKIVKLNNISRAATFVISIGLFIFAMQGYLVPCETIVTPNVWMDDPDPTHLNYIPKYCDNADYDYVYNPNWQYINTTCEPKDLSQRFIKSLAAGSYFIPTLLTSQNYAKCPTARSTTSATTSSLDQLCISGHLNKIGPPQNHFIMWQDLSMLSTTVTVSVPALDYDSRVRLEHNDDKQHLTPLRHDIVLANGTVYQPLSSSDDATGTIIQFTLSEWVEMFGIKNGLDGINLQAGTTESIGMAHHRLVGLMLTIQIEVSNIDTYWKFGLLGDTYARWTLKPELDWSRIALPDVSVGNNIQTTSAYGIRLKVVSLPSKVMRIDAFKTVTSIFDCVVFFAIMKFILGKIVLRCFGEKSKKWRSAAHSNISVLVEEYEDAVRRMKEHRTLEEMKKEKINISFMDTHEEKSVVL